MIRHCGQSPAKAEREFLEWASLFSGTLLMKLVAYADDSGTHDTTGVLPGSREATIAGMVAPREEWAAFCKQWQVALNEFGAPYFHFCEWSNASAVVRNKREASSTFKKRNPYREWDQAKLDSFIVKLATIAGSGSKLIVGVTVSVNLFHASQLAGQISEEANPYEQCADKFFDSVVNTISGQKRPWKRQPIAFFFDQTGNIRFENTVLKMFSAHQKHYRTFKKIAFVNKKELPHLPLQAADMVAYRARQSAENWINGTDRYWEAVDTALFKSLETFVDLHEKTFMEAYFRGAFNYPGRQC